ncbi:hypothetical protein PInf_004179 [Phytophthora infestans]|nr:hypothetical protein PInf_004179 [Phytophthora infestans]
MTLSSTKNNRLQFLLGQWNNVRQRKRDNNNLSSQENEDKRSAPRKYEDNLPDGVVCEEVGPKAISRSPAAANVTSTALVPFTIRINQKAPKTGRPKKDEKQAVVKARVDEKWYQAGQAGRRLAGEVTLLDLAAALDRDKPGLEETRRRLSGVLVRYQSFAAKKPTFSRIKKPVLIQDPFYILPDNLIESCFKLLPLHNCKNTAVDLRTPPTANSKQDAVEVIQIAQIGAFNRKQIETFRRISQLKAHVEQGLGLCRWLLNDALSAMPAAYHDTVRYAAEYVCKRYPDDWLSGLPKRSENRCMSVYTAVPPFWMTDAAIRALCSRLEMDFPTCRFAGDQKATETKRRTRAQPSQAVSPEVATRLRELCSMDEVDTILISVNYENEHWCGIVVKRSAKRILFYDPLNTKAYIRAFKTAPGKMVMITLVCAIVGEVGGSAFGVEIDDGEQVWKAKEVIADKLKYTGRPDRLQLYLAKTAGVWLTENDVTEGVSDTSDLKLLGAARTRLRRVGLSDRDVGGVDEEEEAEGRGPVNVLVVVLEQEPLMDLM